MSGIHDQILLHVQAALRKALIEDVTALPPDDPEAPPITPDPAVAGIVCIGPLQGEPAPDEARISVTLHENDPDAMIGGAVSSLSGDWSDAVDEIEIGGAITHTRRFSVKARCLLDSTAEDLDHARAIAATVRDRMERTLLRLSFTGVGTADEYVSRNILAEEFEGEMLQAGGPGSYDYHIKLRFSLLTTRTGVFA